MTTDKMRAEFEAEARVIGLSLFPMNGATGEYWNDETNLSWRVWKAAYAAGREAERKAIETKLRREIDHATCNAMRIEPMFGQVRGELAVRVSTLEAIIESSKPEGER